MEKWDCFDLLCCDSLPYNNFGVIHDTSGPWTTPGHTRAGGGGMGTKVLSLANKSMPHFPVQSMLSCMQKDSWLPSFKSVADPSWKGQNQLS